MISTEQFQQVAERLLTGQASEEDWQTFRLAFQSGQFHLTADEHLANTITVEGSSNVVGNHNVVMTFTGSDAAAIRESYSVVFPYRLHQIPPSVLDFTGRNIEFEEMKGAIERGATLIGIQGMGGIGKTQIALKLAEYFKPRYEDAQIYLDLKGVSPEPLPVGEAMAHIILAFQPAADIPEKEAALQGLYYSVLEGRRALLLMDNVSGPEQVASLIPPDTCLLLVTSRQHFTLPGLHLIHLDRMSPDDARALLLALAPRIGDKADSLVGLCGYLPLALRLVGSALSVNTNITVASYEQRLVDEQKRLTTFETVFASIQLSYALLNSELQAYWRLLAVFPGTFDSLAAAALWNCTEDHAWEWLSEFLTYSLLGFDGATSRYRLHDLVRLFTHQIAGPKEYTEGQKRFVRYFTTLTQNARRELFRPRQAEWSALLETEYTNLRTVLEWASSNGGDVEQAMRLGGLLSSFWERRGYLTEGRQLLMGLLVRPEAMPRTRARAAALRGASDLSRAQGDFPAAKNLAEESLSIWREWKDRPGIASSLNRLGNTARSMGEYPTALRLLQRSLKIFRQLKDSGGIANTLFHLGLATFAQGNIAASRTYMEESLTLSQEFEDEGNYAAALNGFADIVNAQGNLSDACTHYQKSLEIRRRIGDRRGTADSLIGLGNVEWRQGNYKGIARIQESLQMYEEQEDKRGIANALNEIGTMHRNQGNYGVALLRMRESLRLRKEIGDPRGIANSLAGLGGIAWSQGDYSKARELYVEGLEIRRRLNDKRGIVGLLMDLGLLANDRQDYTTARQFVHESLERRRQMGDLWGITLCQDGLARIAKDEGDYPTAQMWAEQSREYRQASGDNRSIADSLVILGSIAWAQGDYSKARSLYEESLQIRTQMNDGRFIANCMSDLGAIARDMGEFKTAESLYQKSFKIRQEADDKRGMASLWINLGYLARDQGEFTVAKERMNNALSIQQQCEDDRGVTATLLHLGNISWDEGDYVTARSFYERSLARRREIEDIRGIAAALREIGRLSAAQGDFRSARSFLEQSLATFLSIANEPGIADIEKILNSLPPE